MERRLTSHRYNGWQLIKVYWQSDQRFSAFFLLACVILFTILLVAFDVAFTTWYNYFYNALQDYDMRGAIDLLAIFCLMAAIYIVFFVYRYYIQQFLAIRWRRWLTSEFLDLWLAHRSYYYLENFDTQTDNPDQRIQEDINSIVLLTLTLTIGMLSAFVSIFAFIYVLWELSGVINIPLGSLGVVHVHGYLVWVGMIYATIGTFFAFKIGYPLVSLNFEQQRLEANFRFAAIDVRSHAEHVALYRGEENEKSIVKSIFSKVLNNWYAIVLRQKLLMWFTSGYNQISVIIPLAVALPNYFNKVFKLGGLMQAISAFQRIQDSLSFLVNSYTTIAEWRAVIRRLLTFLNHMYELEQHAISQNKFVFLNTEENKVVAKNLNINTPRGELLLANVNAELQYGNHYVVKGPSGIGKSTFVRALAGIWPFGEGEIILPDKKNILFLPQTAYMPIGSLRDALLFPDKSAFVQDEVLLDLLKKCDLSHLSGRLNEVLRWGEHLSPGELQRIAFVRVLLQRPDWVFLDESTSSLDLAHEKALYELLQKELSKCSIVSVGHRPSLDNYHDIVIDLEKYSAHPNQT